MATRTAFLMALALELPWQMMKGARTPIRRAPPYSEASICFFIRRSAGFMSRAPSLAKRPLSIRVFFRISITAAARPSMVFKTTLPTNPSQTTTSTVPLLMSRPSTLPMKWM